MGENGDGERALVVCKRADEVRFTGLSGRLLDGLDALCCLVSAVGILLLVRDGTVRS